MQIKVLFGQRKERYDNEYGPEAMAIVDEFSDSENPIYFDTEVAKIKKEQGSEFVGFSVVWIVVDERVIRNRCLGIAPPINGKITKDDVEEETPRRG
jgi:hypothetical protein